MPASDRTRREWRNRVRLALWLALPFIGLMLLVSPRGDFPLNDDWVYAKMVQALADRGHFGLSPFSNAYALTQTLYAAPLVKLFGFSFTLLRLTTIFMGWITVCFVAFTARELGLPNRSAILAALTVFVNPLFINLSYTFMTDVPFCAFAMISVYWFVKTLQSNNTAHLLFGAMFSIAAFYDRQFGVLVPVSLLVVWSVSARSTAILLRRTSIAALLLPWAACLATIPLLDVPGDQRVSAAHGSNKWWDGWYFALFTLPISFAYLGLLLAPLISAQFVSAFIRSVRRLKIEVTIASVLTYGLCIYLFANSDFLVGCMWFAPPQIIHVVEGFGIGVVAFTFMRAESLENWVPATITVFPTIPETFLLVVFTFLGVLLVISIVSSVFPFPKRYFQLCRNSRVGGYFRSGVERLLQRWYQRVFLVVLSFGMLIAPRIVMEGFYFDRYYLVAIPSLALLMGIKLGAARSSKLFQTVCFALTACATISIVGLQDNMAWNTARWNAIDLLREKYGASNDEINAGYEFNGMYTSDEYLARLRAQPNTHAKKKWWVLGEKYVVSPVQNRFNDVYPFHEQIEALPYYSWLGFQTRYIYVFRDTRPSPYNQSTTVIGSPTEKPPA